MKIFEGLKLFETNITKSPLFNLVTSFYGLKRLRRMWHNHLRKYLLKKRYVNNLTCLCVFIKKLKNDL